MVVCCVISCKNNPTNTKQLLSRVRFFRFPAKHSTNQQEWREVLGIQGQLKGLRICSEHFRDELDYATQFARSQVHSLEGDEDEYDEQIPDPAVVLQDHCYF